GSQARCFGKARLSLSKRQRFFLISSQLISIESEGFDGRAGKWSSLALGREGPHFILHSFGRQTLDA
ncbi:MAG: hypothetical protein AB3N11_12725, partial [Arenibacterium sp.]